MFAKSKAESSQCLETTTILLPPGPVADLMVVLSDFLPLRRHFGIEMDARHISNACNADLPRSPERTCVAGVQRRAAIAGYPSSTLFLLYTLFP